MTTLDVMLPHHLEDNDDNDAAVIFQQAEEGHQVARFRTKRQQSFHASQYDLQCRVTHFNADCVWVWTPIHRQGLSEGLFKRYFGPYKVLQQVGDVDYEVVPEGDYQPLR